MPPSGASWVSQFPTSRATSSLAGSFRTSVESFIAALRSAGASVTISATFRPLERAYLMHYAFQIARQGLPPASVPAYPGVDIQWTHTDSIGNPDPVASRAGATAMVQAYNIVHLPSLTSRHTEGLAIDMNIAWSGSLNIALPTGGAQNITTTPRSGANAELHSVGSKYGVIKLVSDRPHWSNDGH